MCNPDRVRRSAEVERTPIEDAIDRASDGPVIRGDRGEREEPDACHACAQLGGVKPPVVGDHLSQVRPRLHVALIEQFLKEPNVVRGLEHVQSSAQEATVHTFLELPATARVSLNAIGTARRLGGRRPEELPQPRRRMKRGLARRTAVDLDGTARGGDQSDAGMNRDLRGRTRVLRPGTGSADIWHEMRNDDRLTCTLRFLRWTAHHQHRRTDASRQHNAQCDHREPPPQREYVLTGHRPIFPPRGESSRASVDTWDGECVSSPSAPPSRRRGTDSGRVKNPGQIPAVMGCIVSIGGHDIREFHCPAF